ncbi:alpha/beta hydrolase [Acinetobacter proteolyticus]|uniref:esterase/lipase family protein n=1 Tax=Acinetobacter proteolyticus TaxID=1776741 RepID=UPI0008634108|nr:alpha/beta hydrolase [Acinetobacter proteolyticus]OEY94995.1 alpha/beta hydrolase [Acinetobacter proteolyticus]
MVINRKTLIKGIVLFCLFYSLSACQLVKLQQRSLSASLADKTQSILTRPQLSNATQNTLLLSGLKIDQCISQPDQCVQTLQQKLTDNSEQSYAAASEIYLTRALQLSHEKHCDIPLSQIQHSTKQNQCLDQVLTLLDQSIRFSYAYLFETQHTPQQRIFDQRQTQVRLFYNVALSRLITTAYLRYQFTHFPKQLLINQHRYSFNFDDYPELATTDIQLLQSSYNMRFSGFYSVNRRDGFGSEFVLVAKNKQPLNPNYIYDPESYYAGKENPYIHTARYLSVTAVAQPNGKTSVQQLLKDAPLEIQLIDPFRYDEVKVAGQNYLLTANYSAPYGLWLAENNLGGTGYKTLIDRKEQLSMPHLFMLEPYNPNKKIIIFVHGLASSPEAWITLTNDILGDENLRKHYQVWQVFYSTNMPILESRAQIYALLKQAFAMHDPKDAAMSDAVLIGHSMGGIISRLIMGQGDIRQQAVEAINNDKAHDFIFSPAVSKRFIFRPIDQINRIIFIATPHKGTAYADRWFTLALRKVIHLPSKFLNAAEVAVTEKKIDLQQMKNSLGSGIIENGPSDLSYQSKFMKMSQDIQPIKGLAYHSIMGNITQNQDPNKMTDGIVPYTSSHLEGALSEKIIQGGHSIQEKPEAILELRRILKLHVKQHPLPQ